MAIASLAIPQLIVEVNGQPLPAATTGLSQVRIQQRLSLPTLCELTFGAGAKLATGLRIFPR